MKSKKSHKKLITTLVIVFAVLAVLTVAVLGIRRCILGDTKFHSISSVDELFAMQSDKNYRLACDLDLSGQNWEMLRVKKFDGNGHTIRNTVVSKPKIENDQWGYTGFFSYAESITDVTFKNLSVTGIISCVSTHSAIVCGDGLKNAENVSVTDSYLNVIISSNDNSFGYVGSISGGDGRCQFSNCTVKDCTVTVQQANKSNGWLHVGGIAGVVADYNILDCIVENTNITCQSRGYCNFGGLVGELKPVVGTDTIIKNCVARNNHLELNTTANEYSTRFGGAIGNIDKDSVKIENCASINNELKIKANYTYNIAAFAGRNIGTIRNCLSDLNTVNADVNYSNKDSAGYAAGFCGSNYGNISRCVAQDCNVAGTQFTVCSGYVASGFAAYITSSVAYCAVVGGTVSGGNKNTVANNSDFIINCNTYENPTSDIISDLSLDTELWSYTDKLVLNIAKEN